MFIILAAGAAGGRCAKIRTSQSIAPSEAHSHYLRIIPAPRVYLRWDNAPFWYYLAGIIIPLSDEKTRWWSTIITADNQHQVIPIIDDGQHKSSKTTLCGKCQLEENSFKSEPVKMSQDKKCFLIGLMFFL